MRTLQKSEQEALRVDRMLRAAKANLEQKKLAVAVAEGRIIALEIRKKELPKIA